jgi:hypothetical protein
MALVSNKGTKATSSLMPLRTNSQILLRVRLSWFRIERVTSYFLKTILSTRLGRFMLEKLILFLIMLLCIVMRHLALGSTHTKMPKKKIVNATNEHNICPQNNILLSKVDAKYVGGKHKSPKTCVWVPKVLVSNVKGPKTVWVPKNNA